jgi:FAD/FMN-containing dehydrogenase
VVPPTTLARQADWDALSLRLNGRLSRPSAAHYRVDAEIYNPAFDAVRPAGIAFCADAADVARCVTFARQHDLPLAVRCGGHSYGGYSTGPGLVVDVSLMSQVAVSGEMATVGAGARLIDVYSGLNQRGVSIPAGSCPTVGIAGLALGGGIGVMDRLHGLTCDHIVGLEVVTADGRVVQADAGTNADLYWACRGGGGGNFGVVTRFVFSTFATTDVSLFGLSWPWAAAAELLPTWMEWASGGPDELWSNCFFEANGEHGDPLIQVNGVWAGSQADTQAQLAKLIAAVGPPSGQVVGENAFGDAMYIEAGCRDLSQAACHLSDQQPGGTLPRAVTVAKSDTFDHILGDAAVAAVLAGINQRQAEGKAGTVAFDSWGGAIDRVGPGATAFVHRHARASAQYLVVFSEGVAAAAVQDARAWLESWYATMRPYSSGAYQNYIDPYLADWQTAYYGANLARLKKVKAKWDPDNAFHFAQSIPLPGK